MELNRSKPIPVIFDTDMDLDCDDASALAVLHALMDFNEANILGVIVDVPFEASARCVMIINNYYNRLEIPVGLLEYFNNEKEKKYQLYRGAKKRLDRFRDHYTQAVVKHFSSSVVIVAVGLLTALKALLDSLPDDLSPLNGLDLVKLKVNKLITMGVGRFPSAQAVFN